MQVEPTLFLEKSPIWHQFCHFSSVGTNPLHVSRPELNLWLISLSHSQFCYCMHFVNVDWL